MEICLNRHNQQEDECTFHINPRNGYDGETWKKISDTSNDSLVLRTFDLAITNYSYPTQFTVPAIQIIEQVQWNHQKGIDFTNNVLKRFDLLESQCALYDNKVIQRFDAPSVLSELFRLVSFTLFSNLFLKYPRK